MVQMIPSHLYIPDIVKVAQAYGLKTLEIKTRRNGWCDFTGSEAGPTYYVHMKDDIPIQPGFVTSSEKWFDGFRNIMICGRFG